MACESIRAANQTERERKEQIKRALARLERFLATGSVKPVIGRQGAVIFSGWKDRDGVGDACALRMLKASNSSALRMALAKAEAVSGNKVNDKAIAAGIHSHDGGKTWEPGHGDE